GSSTISTLAYFNGSRGAYRDAGLVMDSAGDLYGTTGSGGATRHGTIIELPKGSGTVTVLSSFNGGNGTDPIAGLTMDGTGDLYGTTYEGGTFGDGTVFELPEGSSTIA